MKKAVPCMTNIISALTARTQFGQTMSRAATRNERFVVDRRGEPAVVIMSVNDYVDNFAPEPDWPPRFAQNQSGAAQIIYQGPRSTP